MRFPAKLAAGLAAVTILAAGAFATAGSAAAEEPTSTPHAGQGAKQQRREAFLNHVAENLGVTLDQLKAAFKAAEVQLIDDLVADGTLTPEQGQAAKDKIESGQGIGLGKILGERRKGGGDRLKAIRAGIVRSAATAIGIDPKDLVKELRDGKSIADVADEHGVSLDAVKSQITSDAQSKLDEAVAAGKIDQARADELLQKLTDKLDDILNKKRGAAAAGPQGQGGLRPGKGRFGPSQQG
jgi:polyhydroxyalkanoate synthesis regulator phasin